MYWANIKSLGHPLMTEFSVGVVQDLAELGEGKQGYIHQVELDVENFLNPPTDAYDFQIGKNKHRGDWVFGSAKSLNETKDRLHLGRPTDVITKSYEEYLKKYKDVGIEEVPSVRRRKRWNVDDGEPDVDRAIGGQDYLNRKSKTKAISRIVHLGFQASFNGAYKESTFASIAGAAIAFANVLEDAGYRVKISAIFVTEWNRWGHHEIELDHLPKRTQAKLDKTVIIVPIKHEHENLDEQMLLAWGLTGVLRQYGFSWILALNGGTNSGTMGYTADTMYNHELLKTVDVILTQSDLSDINTKLMQFIKKGQGEE